MILIGEKIERIFNERQMKPTVFAKEIHVSLRNVYNIFSRETIDTNQLYAISKALKFDFFRLYSNMLDNEVHEIRMMNQPNGEYEVKGKNTHRVMIEVELDEDEYKELLKKTRK